MTTKTSLSIASSLYRFPSSSHSSFYRSFGCGSFLSKCQGWMVVHVAIYFIDQERWVITLLPEAKKPPHHHCESMAVRSLGTVCAYLIHILQDVCSFLYKDVFFQVFQPGVGTFLMPGNCCAVRRQRRIIN